MLQQILKYTEKDNGDMEPHLGKPPMKSEIFAARSLMIKLAIIGVIILVITALLSWFVLPPIIGYGLMFAELSLFAVLFRKALPGYGDTEWIVYAPAGFAAFAGYEMYDGKPLNEAMIYIFIAIAAFGLFMSKYAAWEMLKQINDEDWSLMYKHSKECPEVSEYIKKVKASGRDWLTMAEAAAIDAFVEHTEESRLIDSLESGENFREKLFSEIEGR